MKGLYIDSSKAFEEAILVQVTNKDYFSSCSENFNVIIARLMGKYTNVMGFNSTCHNKLKH